MRSINSTERQTISGAVVDKKDSSDARPSSPPLPSSTEHRLEPETLGEFTLIGPHSLPVYYALLLLVAAGGFVAGWLIGRAGMPHEEKRLPTTPGVANRVLLSGHIRFAGISGEGQPDGGAVVLALPADRRPDKPLAIEGLRPWDAGSSQAIKSRERLSEIGGAWGQADENGDFHAVLPSAGRYWVLVISRNLARPAWLTAGSRRGIPELEYEQLTRYFQRPADLIGPQAFRWTLESVPISGLQINHLFVSDDQPRQ